MKHISLFEAAQQPGLQGGLKPRTAESLRQFCRLIIETGDRGERANPIDAAADLVKDIGYEQWIRDQSDNPVLTERRIENTRELLAWLIASA